MNPINSRHKQRFRSVSPQKSPESPSLPRPFPRSTLYPAQCFYLFKRKTCQCLIVTCSLSDSLEHLSLQRQASTSQTPKIFHIAEISVIIDFSPEMRRALVESGVNGRIYGFRLQTRDKSFELGCEELEMREKWANTLQTLRKAYLELHRRDGLRRYVAVLSKAGAVGKDKRKSNKEIQSQAKELKEELKMANSEIVALVLDEMVTCVEVTEERGKLGKLREDLKCLVSFYRSEIGELETELSIYKQKTDLQERFSRISAKRSLPKIWKFTIRFLSFRDLMRLREVSKSLLSVISSVLLSKPYWLTLSPRGFHPRTSSWYLYCYLFTPPSHLPLTSSLTADEKQQIHGDVQRCDFSISVEKLLTAVCNQHPDVGYCQGMHLATQFLRSVLGDDDRTLFVMGRLMNSPYHLSEVWKAGLPRVKLVVYQLEALINLKLPRLSHHFNSIDLPIEILVAPWILTLFTQLVSLTQSRIPSSVLYRIWDLFLTRGWPAIHAVSLCLFRLCEGRV